MILHSSNIYLSISEMHDTWHALFSDLNDVISSLTSRHHVNVMILRVTHQHIRHTSLPEFAPFPYAADSGEGVIRGEVPVYKVERLLALK